MKLCYALRRGVFYPSQGNLFGEMPPKEHRAPYLRIVREIGFDGLELPARVEMGEAEARELRRELEDAGVPAACVRGGGPLAHPHRGPATMARLESTVHFASLVGASVVNLTCVTPATLAAGPGASRVGEPISQGSSRQASEDEFERTADRFRQVGRQAADLGLDVSLEVHQGSICDNSWAALHLCQLIDLTNVGVNPDLGNIFWQYDVPEETCESAIVALAPQAKYWHCKNLKRVPIPELSKAIYLRVPLPDGDVDYRFAIAAMVDAGYQGYLAVEGGVEGDQLTLDARSAAYVRDILASLATASETAGPK